MCVRGTETRGTHTITVNRVGSYKFLPHCFIPYTGLVFYTVGKKSIRALEIVLAIFLCFECQFLSFYACYKEYKA